MKNILNSIFSFIKRNYQFLITIVLLIGLYSQLEKTASCFKNDLYKLERRYFGLGSDIVGVSEKIKSVDKKILDINSNLDKIDSSVKSLDLSLYAINDITAQIENLDKQIKRLDDTAGDIKFEISHLRLRIQ